MQHHGKQRVRRGATDVFRVLQQVAVQVVPRLRDIRRRQRQRGGDDQSAAPQRQLEAQA